jgi:hypothetical protein
MKQENELYSVSKELEKYAKDLRNKQLGNEDIKLPLDELDALMDEIVYAVVGVKEQKQSGV